MYTVALCVDHSYLLPALVTLVSLADATPKKERADVAVCITSPDITPSKARTVDDMARRLGFARCVVHRVHLPSFEVPHGDYISAATYLRFTVDGRLLGRPFVVYLDADLLVLEDLAGGFNDLRTGQIGVVRDEIVQAIGRDEALPGFADQFPAHAGKPYYNAGALWLAATDLPRFRAGSLEQLNHQSRFIYFNDQDALNLWLLDEDCARPLPESYNRFELDRLRERGDWVARAVGPPRPLTGARVVHFIGSRKPWFSCCPNTDAVRAYQRLLTQTRRLLHRLGDLTTDVPREAPRR